MPSESDKHHDQTLPGGVNPTECEASGPVRSGNPMNIQFPCDLNVWHEARRLVADRGVRVEDLAAVSAQDPIIAMELLKTSNSLFFSGGRAITTIKTAVVRLGHDVVLECLERVAQVPAIGDEEVAHWLEVFRSKCKRSSLVSRILAEALARTLSDDCQSAGLFTYIGDMLAVAHFKENYVKLTDEHSAGGVNYYLEHNFRFDVQQMALKYLRKCGIPDSLLLAIDREIQVKIPERAILRPICLAAAEMLEAFDANRWEKLAPGKTPPPKSHIRILQMNESQYFKVYERVAEYLFLARTDEERKRKAEYEKSIGITPESEEHSGAEEFADEAGKDDWSADIEELLRRQEPAEPPPSAPEKKTVNKETPAKTNPVAAPEANSRSIAEQFSLDARPEKKSTPRVEKQLDVAAPQSLRTSKGNEVVSSIAYMFNTVKTSEQLLADLLDMLVKDGPFTKSALIVVSKNRTSAIVVAARGLNISNGQKIALDDPLSPLAQCFSKVQSFGNRESKSSPFGSKTFALAPINADHDTPVALYADCGNNGSLTFEARRIFRTVVQILNEKLPTLPGGIPIEINR